MTKRTNPKVVPISDHVWFFHSCSVLSGYGRDCLDNELDMELDDEEEMDGFTEDRYWLLIIQLFSFLFTALKVLDVASAAHKYQFFWFLVAGSPALCACEFPRWVPFGQRICRLFSSSCFSPLVLFYFFIVFLGGEFCCHIQSHVHTLLSACLTRSPLLAVN